MRKIRKITFIGFIPVFYSFALISDMAFSLPFFAKLSKLYIKCQSNPATNKTGWFYAKQDKVPGINPIKTVPCQNSHKV